LDFGEVWLASYLSEYQTEFSLVTEPQGPNLDKANVMNLFEEFLDTKFGAGQVKLVPEPKEKTVSIPVGYEILETSFNLTGNVEEYIHVPPQMFPPDKGAMAGIVKCKSLRDAFIDEGDFIIITERPKSINGKTILALVNFKVMLKRCEVKAEKVILRAVNETCRPIKVSIKDIICIGEFTGMIRISERNVSD
jgi:SOS-response transcriptional repressor LexA